MVYPYRLLSLLLLSAAAGMSQGRVYLKTRTIDTGAAHTSHADEVSSPILFGSGHLLLQFDQPPTPALVAELTSRGVHVLSDVPDNALLVSVQQRVSLAGLQAHYAAALRPFDRVSPLIRTAGSKNGFYLVEFHPDVDMNLARWLILAANLQLYENPDLQSHQLLVGIPPERLGRILPPLVSRDEIAYVFPASDDLVNRVPVRACEGALTLNGTAGQLIQTFGDGWDGPGLGSATLGYVFSKLTTQLDPTAAQAEIRRAMAEWSKAVKVSWVQGTTATSARTVNVLFGAGYHGDAYPFDGPGGALAHTFYPAPPNPEPIAGDMHLDDAESWRIGSNIDLFSVALHELGHALGLGHSDDPSAVMYPYYRMVTQLSSLDIDSARTLYAAQASTTSTDPLPPPTSPPPPTGDSIAPSVTITSPSTATYSTTASTFQLRGTASDNVGVTTVTWATGFGQSGPATGTTSWTATVPLLVGMNAVTIKAFDASGNVASRTVVITRR